MHLIHKSIVCMKLVLAKYKILILHIIRPYKQHTVFLFFLIHNATSKCVCSHLELYILRPVIT